MQFSDFFFFVGGVWGKVLQVFVFINYTRDTGLYLVFFSLFLEVNYHLQVSSLRIHCILYENYEESFKAQGTEGFTARLTAEFQRHVWNPTYHRNVNGRDSLNLHEHSEPIMAFTILWQGWLMKEHNLWTAHVWCATKWNVSMSLRNYFHMNIFRLRINF